MRATRIAITDLPEYTRATDLEEFLRPLGALKHVHIKHNARTDRSNREAVLQFHDFPVKIFGDFNEGNRNLMDRSVTLLFKETYVRLVVLDVGGERSMDTEDERVSDDAVNSVTSLNVSRVQLGTFVQEDLLYTPLTDALKGVSEAGMQLHFDDNKRRISWLIRGQYGVDFKFEFPFRYLSSQIIMEVDHEDDTYWLTFDLRHAPKIFRGAIGDVEEFGVWEWRHSRKTIWNRIVSVELCPDVDFGEHLVYRFAISAVNGSAALYRKFDRIAKICRSFHAGAPYPVNTRMRVLSELPESHAGWVDLDSLANDIPFHLFYLLQCLVSNSVMPKYAISAQFLELMPVDDSYDFTIAALEMMLVAKERVYDPVETLTSCRMTPLKAKQQVPEHCVLVRKVIVTPTRICYTVPTIELGNRVLRHYSQCAENFLRVGFADEDLEKHLDGANIANELVSRILGVLDGSISISTKMFQFLAFSSSQLRQHSCWFFAPFTENDTTIDSDSLRAWMGDFTDIRTVGKYAARLGQCFSSATPFRAIREYKLTEIPDIERNGFCFSDGIGKISLSLANKISVELGLEEPSCAFQVRMQGYKGVLCADPSIDDAECQVQFRPSMCKFVSNHPSLDIIRTSRYGPAFLNHQIITILQCMMVPTNNLIKLQRAMINRLNLMFDDRHVASDLLTPYSVGNVGISAVIKMIRSSISQYHDPFIANIISLFQCRKLKDVKFKSRIHVEQGVQLIGVLDETGTLEYGQLFVQYTTPSSIEGPGSTVIVKGECLMSKMPAVHVGDARVLKCVDHPALHHYVNVIVFPQKGERPHTYEASGSDLDGDTYFVTWDKSLIPPIRNYEPLDYRAPAPRISAEPVVVSDVTNFMVNFIKNDNLGLIAVSHKIHADLSEKGARSKTCVELAALHSTAVDFAKTGIPAEFDPQKFQVQAYPDFLCRSDRPSYQSKNALGRLFRDVQEKSFRPSYEYQIDTKLLIPGYEKYVQDADAQKRSWDFSIRRLMCQYEAQSEFELVGQMFIAKKKIKGEFEMYEHIHELLRKKISQFSSSFWQSVAQEVGIRETETTWQQKRTVEAYRKASAWYFVCYDRNTQIKALNRAQQPLFSFAWLNCGDLLCAIYQHLALDQKLHIEVAKKYTPGMTADTMKAETKPKTIQQIAKLPTIQDSVVGAGELFAGFQVMSIDDEE